MSDYSTLSSSKCDVLEENVSSSKIHTCNCKSEGKKFSFDTRFFECRPYGLFLRKHSEKDIQPLLKELHELEKKSFETEALSKETIEEIIKKYEKEIKIETKTKTFIISYLMDTEKEKDKFNTFQLVSSLENLIKYIEEKQNSPEQIKSLVSKWIQGNMTDDVTIDEQMNTTSMNQVQMPSTSTSTSEESSSNLPNMQNLNRSLQPGAQQPPQMRNPPQQPPQMRNPPQQQPQLRNPPQQQPQLRNIVPQIPKMPLFTNTKLGNFKEKNAKKNIPKIRLYLDSLKPRFNDENSINILTQLTMELDDFELAINKYSNISKNNFEIIDLLEMLKNIPSIKLLYSFSKPLLDDYSSKLNKEQKIKFKHFLYFILFSEFINDLEEEIKSSDEIKQTQSFFMNNYDTIGKISGELHDEFTETDFETNNNKTNEFREYIAKLNSELKKLI